MKNAYIIAIKDAETQEPILIKKRVLDDISYIGRTYWRAYIFETRKQAMKVWKDWYEKYEFYKEQKTE